MIIDIVSGANPRLKLVRRLADRRGRHAEGKFVAEGINLVREVIERELQVDFLMFSPSDLGYEPDFLRSVHDNVVVCRVSPDLFSSLTDAGSGIGVLAVVSMPGHDLSLMGSLGKDRGILILDRLQDPGNAGTIIRTAAAAGYGMIAAVKGTVDIYSPKVLRATAGMIFEVPVIYAEQDEILDSVRSCGRRLAVTDPSGGIPYYDACLKENIALVIGNEGSGVSEELKSAADIRVTLPMKGRIESLNAAVSAAILMYEAVRR